MIFETIDLYEAFGIKKPHTGGELRIYAREGRDDLAPRSRPAVLVLPGGGYSFCSEREAEPVALKFVAEGYVAAVLNYTVNAAYPTPLVEAAMAAAYLRKNAKRYAFEGKLAVIGFSAGGHLAGMMATLYGAEPIQKTLGKDAPLARADAAILCYPVAMLYSHGGTAQVITGGDETLLKQLSVVECVNSESVPAFIWHTQDDDCVPVANSLQLAAAYGRAGVPYELHVFEHGIHGLSLADVETANAHEALINPAAAQWTPLVFTWLKGRGFSVS